MDFAKYEVLEAIEMYSPTFLHTGNVFTYRVHFMHRNVVSVMTVVY